MSLPALTVREGALAAPWQPRGLSGSPGPARIEIARENAI